MQVKFSISCDLSQVPFKVSEILDERINTTQEHLDFFKVGVVNNLHNGKEPTLSMIEEIDKFRKTLYFLDSNLLEASQALTGYVQNRLPQSDGGEMSQPSIPNDNQLKELQEALNKLGGVNDDTSSEG
tara:strand:+ start:505 stop:888 length:384 start_codon:yes stop_codon:yes gene_type:complete